MRHRCLAIIVALMIASIGARSVQAQSRPPDPNRLSNAPGWYFPKSAYSSAVTSALAKHPQPGWYLPTGSYTGDLTKRHIGWSTSSATANSETTGGYNYQGFNRPGWYENETETSAHANSPLTMKLQSMQKGPTATTSTAVSKTSSSAAIDPSTEKQSSSPPPSTTAVAKARYYFQQWNPKVQSSAGKPTYPAAKRRSGSRPGLYPYNAMLVPAGRHRSTPASRSSSTSLIEETAATSSTGPASSSGSSTMTGQASLLRSMGRPGASGGK